MKHKKLGLIIVVVTAFTILTTGCSITVTRNYYSAKPKAPKTSIKIDSTACVLKLDSHLSKPNDGQK